MLLVNYLFSVGLLLASQIYEGQQILDCKVSDRATAEKLENLDILYHQKDITRLRVVNEAEKKLASSVTSCKVAFDDLTQFANHQLQKYSRSGAASTEGVSLADEEFFKDYRSYDETKAKFSEWASKYPEYAKFVPSIGKSIEGRDIFGIEITSKASTGDKKDILYTGGQHAREWISPALSSYITLNMLKDADKDAQVKKHLESFTYRIFPIINPDGYQYSRTSQRFWRKNRRNNGDGSYGVDLNRNWDYKWSVVGSSSGPSFINYHGKSPASEPEIQAIQNYVGKLPRAYGAIDWHSNSEQVLRSWGWTTESSSNEPILKKLGDSVTAAINSKGYNFESIKGAELYPASGAADDYYAFKARTVALTVESCTGGSMGFDLPPNQILPCSAAMYAGSKQFSQFLLENPNIPPIKDIPN